MPDKQGVRKLLNLEVGPDSPTVIIYSEQTTNRLDYVCRFIFEHVLKIKYVLTSGVDEFEASGFYKINYSLLIIESSFRIVPHGLLFQTGIKNDLPRASIKNNQLYFYKDNNGADFEFDIFSAVFYMISRYEEWQPFEADVHGRFELSQSILYKNNQHLKPVVDLWILELRKALAHFYPSILFPVLQFKTISTIDVDNLFAYSNKGFVRTAGAAVKDLFKGDLKNFLRRFKTVAGKKSDPFDIYEEFTNYCGNINVPVFYFFLFRSGTRYDRTIDPSSPVFREVFAIIKENGGHIGIHPSYESSVNEKVLDSEINEFSKALREPVNVSRQHFLRFNIRTTPLQLLKHGIHSDFTMGFASGAGFRAGTSHPFFYYDFEKEQERELLFVPFCAMDGAYTVYKNMSAPEAMTSLKQLRQEIKDTNGLFITVFHERTFADYLHPGFATMYKALIK